VRDELADDAAHAERDRRDAHTEDLAQRLGLLAARRLLPAGDPLLLEAGDVAEEVVDLDGLAHALQLGVAERLLLRGRPGRRRHGPALHPLRAHQAGDRVVAGGPRHGAGERTGC
jgi:hypothetical protein